MQMELSPNSRVPDGLLAAMTLLSEKPHQGLPSWESAPHPGIDERNCTALLGLRFRSSEIVSGTVVAFSNGAERRTHRHPSPIFACHSERSEESPHSSLTDGAKRRTHRRPSPVFACHSERSEEPPHLSLANGAKRRTHRRLCLSCCHSEQREEPASRL